MRNPTPPVGQCALYAHSLTFYRFAPGPVEMEKWREERTSWQREGRGRRAARDGGGRVGSCCIMLSQTTSTTTQRRPKRKADSEGVDRVTTTNSSTSLPAVVSKAPEAKKKKSKPKRKKSRVHETRDGVAAPIVKLPKSASDASTNWKLLLSQKSADIAKKKSEAGGAPFYQKNSSSFLRRDRKKFQKRRDMSTESLNQANNNDNVTSVGQKLAAQLIVDESKGSGVEVSGKGKESLPPIKGLNALGCFDYTHYGHLKTTILDEHKYLTESTKAVAIDCEMVGVGPLKEDALARVSVVNEFGYCLYDSFVKPKAPVTDYRTEYSGVREEDLKNAQDCQVVIKAIAELVKGRIIVGHSLKNDLTVLFLKHPHMKIRDTAPYFKKKFKKPRTPSLKSITKEYLGVDIQEGEHSSITDAQATMRLYLFCREEWEDAVAQKFRGGGKVKKYWTAKEYKMAFQALGGLKTLKSRSGRK